MKHTLEQLEVMSDFDIDIIIADIIGIDWFSSPSDYRNTSGGWMFSSDSIECDTRLPSYCNSWADMGPLIHEAKIAGRWWRFAPNLYCASSMDMKYTCTDKNPLRAAAIVYILVKQGEL